MCVFSNEMRIDKVEQKYHVATLTVLLICSCFFCSFPIFGMCVCVYDKHKMMEKSKLNKLNIWFLFDLLPWHLNRQYCNWAAVLFDFDYWFVAHFDYRLVALHHPMMMMMIFFSSDDASWRRRSADVLFTGRFFFLAVRRLLIGSFES